MTNTPEIDLRLVAVQRAMKLLNSAGALYAIQYKDETYGLLQVVPYREPKRKPRYPYGATRAYYSPLIEDMQPGDVVVVPAGEFDLAVLASNISAYCFAQWGKRGVITQKDRATQTVYVLRLEPPDDDLDDAEDEQSEYEPVGRREPRTERAEQQYNTDIIGRREPRYSVRDMLDD